MFASTLRPKQYLAASAVLLLIGASLFAGPLFIDHVIAWSLAIGERLRFGACWLPLLLMSGAWLVVFNKLGVTPFTVGLGLWLLGAGLSGLHRGPTPFFFWGAALPYLLAAACAAGTVVLRPERSTVKWGLLIGASLVAITVLLDAHTSLFSASLRRPGGLLGNRNYAGEYLALSLPLVLALDRRRLVFPLLVAIGMALALTRCRTAWVAALLAVLLVHAWSANARRALPVVAAALALGVLLASVVPNRLRWMEDKPLAATASRLLEVGSGSGALRLRQYRETFELVGARFVGPGPGVWQAAMRLRAPDLAINKNPHSDYLRSLSDGGLLGMLGLVVMLVQAAWSAWRRRAFDPGWFACVCVMGLVCALDCPLYRPEGAVLIVGSLAMMAARSAEEPVCAGSSIRRPRLPVPFPRRRHA